MLRTVIALLVLAVVAVVATARTGPFWLTLVAGAAALVLGATVLSLLGTEEEDADDESAEVRPFVPPPARPSAGRARNGARRPGAAA